MIHKYGVGCGTCLFVLREILESILWCLRRILNSGGTSLLGACLFVGQASACLCSNFYFSQFWVTFWDQYSLLELERYDADPLHEPHPYCWCWPVHTMWILYNANPFIPYLQIMMCILLSVLSLESYVCSVKSISYFRTRWSLQIPRWKIHHSKAI